MSDYSIDIPAEPGIGAVVLDKDGQAWQRHEEKLIERDGRDPVKVRPGWHVAWSDGRNPGHPADWPSLLLYNGPLRRL